MARTRFTITREKFADRCEICHKTDMFEPKTGICLRCNSLPEDLVPKAAHKASNPPPLRPSILWQIYSFLGELEVRITILVVFLLVAGSVAGGMLSLSRFKPVRTGRSYSQAQGIIKDCGFDDKRFNVF